MVGLCVPGCAISCRPRKGEVGQYAGGRGGRDGRSGGRASTGKELLT